MSTVSSRNDSKKGLARAVCCISGRNCYSALVSESGARAIVTAGNGRPDFENYWVELELPPTMDVALYRDDCGNLQLSLPVAIRLEAEENGYELIPFVRGFLRLRFRREGPSGISLEETLFVLGYFTGHYRSTLATILLFQKVYPETSLSLWKEVVGIMFPREIRGDYITKEKIKTIEMFLELPLGSLTFPD